MAWINEAARGISGISYVKIQGTIMKCADSCDRFNLHHNKWGYTEYLYDKKLFSVFVINSKACAFFVPEERSYINAEAVIKRKKMFRAQKDFITEALSETDLCELTSPYKKEYMTIAGKRRVMYRFTREDGQKLWLEYADCLRYLKVNDCLWYQAKDDITAPVTVWTKGRWQRLVAIIKPIDLKTGDVPLYDE